MRLQPVYLLCGVPGSGKTWVMQQLKDLFTVVNNDDFLDDSSAKHRAIKQACLGDKPVITDCPFGERLLRDSLEDLGLDVIPYFIVEPVPIVMQRYQKRTGKPLPQASITRASTIINRATEWNAEYGTSSIVLEKLKLASRHHGASK